MMDLKTKIHYIEQELYQNFQFLTSYDDLKKVDASWIEKFLFSIFSSLYSRKPTTVLNFNILLLLEVIHSFEDEWMSKWISEWINYGFLKILQFLETGDAIKSKILQNRCLHKINTLSKFEVPNSIGSEGKRDQK